MTTSYSRIDLAPTRETLVTRLKDWEDQEGWREFFDTYSELIYKTALKAGLTPTEASEVVQETVITVAKKIATFKPGAEHGSFKGWLLNTTRWRIADQFRKRAQHPQQRPHRPSGEEITSRTSTIDCIADPAGPELEMVWNEEWDEYRLETALGRLRKNASGKAFQIFQLLIRRQLPAEEVAKMLGVSRTLVYVTKHRLGRQFKRELARIDREIE